MQTSGPLACQDARALIADYLENALHWADRARLEAHFARCTGCQARLDTTKQTIRWLGQLPAPPLEPAARRACLDLFRAWKARAAD
jgi:anti-sigma factor RsiW